MTNTVPLAQQRDITIDVLRGIGMLFVVAGHANVPTLFLRYERCFAMPLFFFISGYLYKGDTSPRWLARKADTLLIPYLIWGPIILLLQASQGFNPIGLFRSFIRFNGVGPLWFFTALFAAELIGALCVKLCRQRPGPQLATFLALAALGYYIPKLHLFPQHFASNALFCGTSIWIAGHIVRTHNLLEQIRNKGAWPTALFAAACFALWSLTLLQPIERLDGLRYTHMQSGTLGIPALYYTAALGSVLFAFAIRGWLPKWRFLTWVGRNGLLVLMLHVIIPGLVLRGFALAGLDMNATVVLKTIQRAVNLGLVFGLVWIMERYTPFLAGKLVVFGRLVRKKQ